LFREPASSLWQFGGRKELHRCAPNSRSGKSQGLNFPARIADDGNLCDFAAVSDQKIEIIPIGAGFPAFKIFDDRKQARL